MSERTLPYYKWFWQDWRANRKIQRMSYIERGLYRELLDECWAEGSIPNDIDELADICGCPADVMASAWQVLSKCFIEIDNGRLINEKLHSLRTEKDAERAKKALNGQKGGIAKSLKTQGSVASAKQVPSSCHIEEKIREDKKREDIAPPNGVAPNIFSDYLKIRKAKKSPWTKTAQALLEKEASKAGISLQDAMEMCCARGWVGFKAEWLTKAQNATSDKSWMFSNEGIERKARELGVSDYGVQTHQQLKDKILLVMAKQAIQ